MQEPASFCRVKVSDIPAAWSAPPTPELQAAAESKMQHAEVESAVVLVLPDHLDSYVYQAWLMRFKDMERVGVMITAQDQWSPKEMSLSLTLLRQTGKPLLKWNRIWYSKQGQTADTPPDAYPSVITRRAGPMEPYE